MNSSALAAPSQKSAINLTTGYLNLQFAHRVRALIPIAAVQEVIALPTHRLTAIPHQPAPILGLMNRRSQLLWVADLAYLLGIGRVEELRNTLNAVVIRSGHLTIGCAVAEVNGMIPVPAEKIQPPVPQLPPGVLPYLEGCTVLDEELLLVINPDAIAQSPIFHR
ncbi:MAG: chemotaxis protein CheW [Synechococcales bacterium]|nr:chemotaxis protein CheW [Synechococcales bacterium]